MTTERNAQGVDGLAEVMGLLDSLDRDARTMHDIAHSRANSDSATREEVDCLAIALRHWQQLGALRSHGEAIRELVEADREYDAAMAQRWRIDGGTRFMDAKRRRSAALAKFPEPRP